MKCKNMMKREIKRWLPSVMAGVEESHRCSVPMGSLSSVYLLIGRENPPHPALSFF